MKTLPLHEPLVDPKTGKINRTSTWVSILGAEGLSGNDVNALSALQFKALIASVRVGAPGGPQIAENAITAANIGSVNANTIIGNITANQIGSINAENIVGNITANQIGSINANSITGTITADQIGSINADVITSGQINTAGVVNCASLTGTIGSAVTVNAATVTITGGWSGSQIAMATISGTNIGPATIVYGNIASVDAGAIVSVGGSAISASVITELNAGAISVTGQWASGSIGTLNAGSITVTGGWAAGQISSVNAGTINTGILNAITCTGLTITGSTIETTAGIGSAQPGIIMTAASNQATYWGYNHSGATSAEILAVIGVNSFGSSAACAIFGSETAGNNIYGLVALSNSASAIYALSETGVGVEGHGISTTQSAGVYGSGYYGGQFVANTSNGAAISMTLTTQNGSYSMSSGGTQVLPTGFYNFWNTGGNNIIVQNQTSSGVWSSNALTGTEMFSCYSDGINVRLYCQSTQTVNFNRW